MLIELSLIDDFDRYYFMSALRAIFNQIENQHIRNGATEQEPGDRNDIEPNEKWKCVFHCITTSFAIVTVTPAKTSAVTLKH